MTPGIASIHLTYLGKKVESGFGLSRNSFLNGLVPVVFLKIFLLGLGTDGGF